MWSLSGSDMLSTLDDTFAAWNLDPFEQFHTGCASVSTCSTASLVAHTLSAQ